jgi:HD-GYP domain-containing protein (c-di-GMP phosphodiesterase class II)
MAIADIFEALTAADRPDKKGKRLSESLLIMADMCKNAHMDPQLFGLFVRTNIYRRYADRFMQAQQIDEIDGCADESRTDWLGGGAVERYYVGA